MGKQKVLQMIGTGWNELLVSMEGLSDRTLEKKRDSGDWSIKDILGHVTTWESEALKYLPIIVRGERPSSYRREYGGIDSFNALQTQQKAKLPIAQILDDFHATHDRLVAYLESVPEEYFTSGTRFLRRLGWDTFKHYPEHTRAILEQKNG